MLLKLELDDTRHRGRYLWIDTDGTLYYGPDEGNLICSDVLEVTGRLPELSLLDIRRAFLLGKSLKEEL